VDKEISFSTAHFNWSFVIELEYVPCVAVCCSSIGVLWFKDRISIFSLKIRLFSAIGCTCLYTCLESMSLYWTYLSEIDWSNLKIWSFSAVSCTCLYACPYVTLLDIHVWDDCPDLKICSLSFSRSLWPRSHEKKQRSRSKIEIRWPCNVAVCCSVLQSLLRCSVLQCVAFSDAIRNEDERSTSKM